MQHEAKKISLIINELVTLFLQMGTGNIDVAVNRSSDATEITFTQDQADYSEEFREKLFHSLNVHRQVEVEAYYWQLMGDDDSDDELLLLGAMIDQAWVTQDQGILQVKVLRKLII